MRHPSQWPCSGYNEIQNPPERYVLINQKALVNIYGMANIEQLRNDHKNRVEEAVNNGNAKREPAWSESIAVGNKEFVEQTKEKLGFRAQGRGIIVSEDNCMLREPRIPYNAIFDPKKASLNLKNTYFWNETDDIATG